MIPFKFDENLPIEAAALFREAGHDAATVLDQDMKGYADQALAQVCADENRALVTLDVDFADITAYPPSDYPGIVFLDCSNFVIRAIEEGGQKGVGDSKCLTNTSSTLILKFQRLLDRAYANIVVRD